MTRELPRRPLRENIIQRTRQIRNTPGNDFIPVPEPNTPQVERAPTVDNPLNRRTDSEPVPTRATENEQVNNDSQPVPPDTTQANTGNNDLESAPPNTTNNDLANNDLQPVPTHTEEPIVNRNSRTRYALRERPATRTYQDFLLYELQKKPALVKILNENNCVSGSGL